MKRCAQICLETSCIFNALPPVLAVPGGGPGGAHAGPQLLAAVFACLYRSPSVPRTEGAACAACTVRVLKSTPTSNQPPTPLLLQLPFIAQYRKELPALLALHGRSNQPSTPLLPQIPFIAQYRKELCGELLAVRYRDEPNTVDEGEANSVYPRGSIKVGHGCTHARLAAVCWLGRPRMAGREQSGGQASALCRLVSPMQLLACLLPSHRHLLLAPLAQHRRIRRSIILCRPQHTKAHCCGSP